MKHVALLLALLAPTPALAQLPAPWVERALPDRFGQLYGLACSSDTAFARSWQGRAARLDESGWTPLERVPGPGNSGRPLWVSRDGGVLFTSTQDAIVRYHDGAWTAFEAPLGYEYTNQILSFDGEHAFAVGTGRIVAWSGARYAPYDPGTWRQLHAIGGRAEDDLWVGGEAGAVTHFDGDHFTSHRIDTEGTVIQLWTPAADDLWAVTERPSHVFHRDGDRWTDRTPRGEHLRVASLGGDADHVYAVGNFGVVRWRSGRWADVHRVEIDRYALPQFTTVCATATHVVIGEAEHRTWVSPLPD